MNNNINMNKIQVNLNTMNLEITFDKNVHKFANFGHSGLVIMSVCLDLVSMHHLKNIGDIPNTSCAYTRDKLNVEKMKYL